MGLENVKKEIMEKAEERAKEIIIEAHKEAASIGAKADVEIKEYEKEALKHAEELFQSMERRLLAAARFDAQRLIRNTKKTAIDKVFETVKEKTISLNSQERKKILNKLLKRAEKEIDVYTVFVNKRDIALIEGKTKETNINGGLLAETKDGMVSVNLSLNELLENARNQMLIKVNEVLFK